MNIRIIKETPTTEFVIWRGFSVQQAENSNLEDKLISLVRKTVAQGEHFYTFNGTMMFRGEACLEENDKEIYYCFVEEKTND